MPFTLPEGDSFIGKTGDYVFVPNIRKKLYEGDEEFPAKLIDCKGNINNITLCIKNITDTERQIMLDGCLMNYYKNQNA